MSLVSDNCGIEYHDNYDFCPFFHCFDPSSGGNDDDGLNGAEVFGIVIGCLFIVACPVMGIFLRRKYQRMNI